MLAPGLMRSHDSVRGDGQRLSASARSGNEYGRTLEAAGTQVGESFVGVSQWIAGGPGQVLSQ